jgi:hypothetical protein
VHDLVLKNRRGVALRRLLFSAGIVSCRRKTQITVQGQRGIPKKWLSDRIFKPDADILDHCSFTKHALIDQPSPSCRWDGGNGHAGSRQQNLL